MKSFADLAKKKSKPKKNKTIARGANTAAVAGAAKRLADAEANGGTISLSPAVLLKIADLQARNLQVDNDLSAINSQLPSLSDVGHNHAGVYLTETEVRAQVAALIAAST